jgi:UDP-N-acetylglucosamine 2-epimerase
MKIGIFSSYREHIMIMAPIYHLLRAKGHRVYLYDVLEERGWFEKGVQYVSLDYDRSSLSIEPGLDEDAIEYLARLFEDDDLDLIMYGGYSPYLLRVAVAAKMVGTPILHIGSGLRSYVSDEEEILRQLTDHLIPFHVTYHPRHSNNLLREGFKPDYIKLTGCPIVDIVIQKLDYSLRNSSIIDELEVGENDYIAMELGNVRTLDYMDEFKEFSRVSGEYLIIPLAKNHKRYLVEKGEYMDVMERYDIMFIEVLDYIDHLCFLYNSRAVVTDSELVAMEGLLLGKPTTLIVESGRRPLILDDEYTNILYLEGSLGRRLNNIYMRRGRDVRRIFGGGAASDNISEYIHEIVDKPLLYPKLALYVLGDGDLVELAAENLPSEYRGLVSSL